MAAEQKTTDTRTNAQSSGLESRREARDCDNCGRALVADHETEELTCYACGLIYGDDETAEPAEFRESAPKTEHTPGPWKAQDESNYSAPIIEGDGRPVAEVYGDGLEQRKANARLIAAAPDLLEALKTLFRECAMVHKHWGENCNQAAADAAVTKANAAIFKAEGTARQ